MLDYDVVIAGAGIGGSALATVLARAGRSVLVLEKKTAYRDRVRGEWMAPWGVAEARARDPRAPARAGVTGDHDMDPRLRARMLYHGAVVILLGLLAGFPHAFVLTGQLAGDERAWRMAHMEGLLNGMLVLLAAAVSGWLVLSARQQAWLAGSLVVAAYGNVVASTLGAIFGVRGLDLAGPPANAVMNLLFWVAIAGVLAGVGLLIAGARAAVRADRP